MKKTTKKTETDDSKPFVSNYPPLQEWLIKHNARCMWQIPSNPKPRDADWDWTPGSYIEQWAIGRHLFIIVVHSNKMGWDIFTNKETPRIDETLRDVELRLGLVCSNCGVKLGECKCGSTA
jgi:hypothetical protein